MVRGRACDSRREDGADGLYRRGYMSYIVSIMTDAPESKTEMATATGQPSRDERYERPSRLGQAVAWVGIVAGVVFVVAVIFFSGVLLGWSSYGHYGWHRGGWGDGTGDRAGTCPMMNTGGMMKPGEMGPMGPMAPMGPSQSPATSVPTTPRP